MIALPPFVCKRQLRALLYALSQRCLNVSPKDWAEAAAISQFLQCHGIASTPSKFSKPGDSAEAITHEYLRLSDTLGRTAGKAGLYLSVKAPALDFELPKARAITRTAFGHGQPVHFDSLGLPFVDETRRLLDDLMEESRGWRRPQPWQFGLTLPSRWQRSRQDAAWVADHGMRPRLVKGEYPAAKPEETDPGKGYVELVRLLAGKVPEIALATHDRPLAKTCIELCQAAGTPVQLELLFGMPVADMLQLAATMNVPAGFYVPYGDTLALYGISHYLRHPHKLLRPGSLELIGGFQCKLNRIVRGIAPDRKATALSFVRSWLGRMKFKV